MFICGPEDRGSLIIVSLLAECEADQLLSWDVYVRGLVVIAHSDELLNPYLASLFVFYPFVDCSSQPHCHFFDIDFSIHLIPDFFKKRESIREHRQSLSEIVIECMFHFVEEGILNKGCNLIVLVCDVFLSSGFLCETWID